jgi:hypothetical protein
MRYLPGSIAAADLTTVEAAYLGGEFAIYLATVGAVKIGEIDVSAAGVGAWVPAPGVSIKSGGADLQVIPRTPILSSVATVINLATMDNSGSPVAMNAAATFVAPSRAANQSFNFERGYAVDLIPAVSGKQYTSITGLAALFAVSAVSIHSGGAGTGYVVNDLLSVPGTGTAATIKVLTVTSGAITTFQLLTPGSYTVTPTTPATLTGGSGTGASFDLTVISGAIVGGGQNQIYDVYQLPEAADYTLIPATMDVDFNTKSRKAVGIDAGMEADFWIKRGKSQPGDLRVGSKLQSFAEGLARLDGFKGTLMAVGLKDGQVIGDRLIWTEAVLNVDPKLPDGLGEATISASGKFSNHGFFVAP